MSNLLNASASALPRRTHRFKLSSGDAAILAAEESWFSDATRAASDRVTADADFGPSDMRCHIRAELLHPVGGAREILRLARGLMATADGLWLQARLNQDRTSINVAMDVALRVADALLAA